jgi:hypothetical protein
MMIETRRFQMQINPHTCMRIGGLCEARCCGRVPRVAYKRLCEALCEALCERLCEALCEALCERLCEALCAASV